MSAKHLISAITFFIWAGSAGMAQAGESKDLHLDAREDYGSGSLIHTFWYAPGGLGPGVGLFVGHPNTLPRSDRVVVRYNLCSYLLTPITEISLSAARLTFRVELIYGKEPVRRIEISHLGYDALGLSGNDIANGQAEVVGVVAIDGKSATARSYAIDVTGFVKKDLWKGNKYTAFRFRDVDAEGRGNPDMKPVGVVLQLNGPLPFLEIRGPARE